MKTTAARLYGKDDLRLETFDLRDIRPDEVLAKVICDSVCMSSYKTLKRGKPASLYPEGNRDAPVIIGHELAAEIVQVGADVAGRYKVGQRFGVQAAMVIDGVGMAPGYNFAEFGGAATYIIVPPKVLTSEYLLWFDEKMSFYQASLGEPYACLIFALYANFHTKRNTRGMTEGICQGGAMAIMGGGGPMGFGGVELVLNMDKRPGVLVVTDIDQARLDRAAEVISPEYAAQKGVTLHYVNTAAMDDPVAGLRALTEGGAGFDDIYIMCPVQSVIELADKVCNYSCCINFFSGPVDTGLSASVNFHAVHYNAKHIIGSASSGVVDMQEVLDMAAQGRLRPEVMVTHVGGLNCAVDTICALPSVPGGKKLLYCNIDMELTAIEDFGKRDDPLSRGLDEICRRHNMLWSSEAEAYLLANGKPMA